MKSAKRTYVELVTKGGFTIKAARRTRGLKTVEDVEDVEEYLLELEVPPHPLVERVFLRVGRCGETEYDQLCLLYRSGQPNNFAMPQVLAFAEAKRIAARLIKQKPAK